MYHIWGHIGHIDWAPGGKGYEHIQHIKGKKDAWYAGFGQMYMYHYAQSVANVTMVLDSDNILFKLKLKS
jgi:hypothetical protein